MAVAPSGTVTFLFTDVEGSTELLRRLREEYGSAVEPAPPARARGGRTHTAASRSTRRATRSSSPSSVPPTRVRAAIDAQRALAEHEWPDGATVRVRMGLHTGEALLEDGRYHGLSVHRAARISGVAHGGQVLLSESTRSLLADEEQLSGVGFRDLGPLALKDFDRPIRVYRLAGARAADVDRKPRRAGEERRRWVVAAAVVAGGSRPCSPSSLVIAWAVAMLRFSVPADSVAVVDPASGQGPRKRSRSGVRRTRSSRLERGVGREQRFGHGHPDRRHRRMRRRPIGGFQSAPYATRGRTGQSGRPNRPRDLRP